jgi:uncharacterized protein YerC
MPKVSRIPLDKDIENEMLSQFWVSLSKINDPVLASHFFSDLLTENERIMLAKRFTIAVLLARGKSASDIKSILHVTYSTIGSVSSWLKNAKPKTQKLMEQISKEKDWETLSDKIEELLDKLPPLSHGDWSKSGKEKWQRIKSRAAKRNLR